MSERGSGNLDKKVSRICHVCSGHTADDVRVFHKECRSLAQAGYDVHLIATDATPRVHESQGLTIYGLSHCESRLARVRRRWSVARLAKSIAADLYHVHEPELLGPVLRAVSGVPVIFDAHESYLDVLGERQWIPAQVRPVVRWYWDRVERNLVPQCAAIVAATEYVASRYTTFASRVVIARNYAALENIPPHEGPAVRDGGSCVFAGVLKPDRNLRNTVLALALLRRQGVKAHLRLAGGWSSEDYKNDILEVAKAEGIEQQIRYLGILKHSEALSLEASSDIGLVNILPIANSRHSLPIKLFECMALGLPVVYSDFLAADIRGLGEVGISVDPSDPKDIARAIAFLIDNPEVATRMGQTGKRRVMEAFNWDKESTKLLALYDDLLLNRSGAD